ncbi:MAG: YebC/PmpR family DNA-binding transcriptional regulator [Candidatus Pacebacteria bacterium]|nr:YebC/PmpR family DNA-binding transcriptional regulator [Candidatus Paceibacterota bacterium]
MAGHSKWSNIKNRKAAVDKKRGKIFSKLSRQIRIAVKEGKSGDPETNPTLRTLIDKARAANMPKDNIQKAINRGLGKSASGAALQETVYEGFGPGGVGILVVTVTDNANRTLSEIRQLFDQANGSLGAPGSVQYMFERDQTGEYRCTIPVPVTDQAVKTQLEALLEKLEDHEDVEEVYSAA